MRLTLRILTLVLALAGGLAAARATTIDFENLPDANFFSAGDVNIDSFYSGVTFGPDVTGLSVTRFGGYNNIPFPPHSGDVVVWSATSNDVLILFAQPLSSVGLFYTSLDPLTLQAFDAGNVLLGTVIGNPNTDGFDPASSDPLFISASGITSIKLSGLAQDFVFDDLTFTPAGPPTTVPEPATWTLVGTALLGLATRKRIGARFHT